MVICPGCRSEQMNGTLFCGDCGADLQTPAAPTFDLAQQIANAPLPPVNLTPRTSQPNPSKSTMPPARPIVAADNMPVPSKSVASSKRAQSSSKRGFRMLILNSGRVVDCPDQENVIIGRSDKMLGEFPDVDLNPDNGLELGVSRRHACITFRDDQVYMTDLGSTNRTFLNRQAMMKGQPYEIHDGDEVRLGNVIMKIMYTQAK